MFTLVQVQSCFKLLHTQSTTLKICFIWKVNVMMHKLVSTELISVNTCLHMNIHILGARDKSIIHYYQSGSTLVLVCNLSRINHTSESALLA